MEKISSVIYLSEENEVFNDKKIHKLVAHAQKQNFANKITGFLYYKKGLFFQYIEGEKYELNRLLDNIKNDSRHRVLESLYEEELVKRRFLGWQMGYLKTNELIQIKQEDIIIDYLSMMKKYNDLNIEGDFASIWRLVDSLAKYKNKGLLSK